MPTFKKYDQEYQAASTSHFFVTENVPGTLVRIPYGLSSSNDLLQKDERYHYYCSHFTGENSQE